MVQAGDQGKFVVILLFDNYCFFDVNECIYTYMYIDAMQVHEHIDNKKSSIALFLGFANKYKCTSYRCIMFSGSYTYCRIHTWSLGILNFIISKIVGWILFSRRYLKNTVS